ncbi:basic-leucine zipper transcription factor [Mucor lusitanicus]|uniref:Basic-leucine zipper transcription factor n=2 Tax=Mucor circinelloides f. lusitanicus TaxID=29924 RepID=A0A168HTX1_MUCCL|nr:basic-leucine zipper transcription factor [Mucor lusitanicus CBS 277.49]
MFPNTQSTSVMSIGAITSPDSAKTGCQLPSLCEMTNSSAAAAVDSSRDTQTYVGHWVHNNSSSAPSDRYPTYPMMRTPSSSSLSNRSRFPSISMPSPSFSSSSSNASEHDDEDEAHHHHHLSHHPHHHSYQHSRQDSLFSNFESTTFGSSSRSSSSVGRSRSLGNKSDAVATRRARNKLASAKYRAKKQALTHAMQDRIMQLATQVMNLREELTITKKSEIDIKTRYERLMQYHNTVHTSPPTATTTSTSASTRLY